MGATRQTTAGQQIGGEYIATGKSLTYVDLWSDSIGPDGMPKPELYVEDKLHPSTAGYALRTRLLLPHLP